jgi:ribonucleotide reductase beta subunit family protein with ferritin-like domain
MEALNWNAQEVDLSRDQRDWNKMSEDQRHFVKMQLAFFARVDIDVLGNLDGDYGHEINCMEAQFALVAQKNQECVHAESYGLQIEAVMEGAEREAVLNAVSTMPVIAKMRTWVLKHFQSDLPIGERLIAAAATEGVLFSASFSALQWLKELNLLPGITDFNTFIVRDEGIHTQLTCLFISYLREQPLQERAAAIFSGVVEILDEFVAESLPVRLIGMNADLMMQYVRFQADCVLMEAGYKPIYRVENPFKFMDKLSLNEVAKTNFFEHRPSQYQNIVKTGQSKLAVDDSEVN